MLGDDRHCQPFLYALCLRADEHTHLSRTVSGRDQVVLVSMTGRACLVLHVTVAVPAFAVTGSCLYLLPLHLQMSVCIDGKYVLDNGVLCACACVWDI